MGKRLLAGIVLYLLTVRAMLGAFRDLQIVLLRAPVLRPGV